MKNRILMVTVLGLAAAVVGCNKSNTEQVGTGDTNSTTATVTAAATNAWQDVKTGSAAAWDDVKDSLSSTNTYTFEQKDVYISDATNDLAIMDQKIQTLSDKAAAASDNVKADAQAKIQDLRAKRATLDQKLTDLKNSTAANWNDVENSFQSAYDDTKASVKSTWQWLKDKMS